MCGKYGHAKEVCSQGTTNAIEDVPFRLNTKQLEELYNPWMQVKNRMRKLNPNRKVHVVQNFANESRENLVVSRFGILTKVNVDAHELSRALRSSRTRLSVKVGVTSLALAKWKSTRKPEAKLSNHLRNVSALWKNRVMASCKKRTSSRV
ncbi:hypothetical protein GQ457_12G010110 [Hibiscus cannabinus]